MIFSKIDDMNDYENNKNITLGMTMLISHQNEYFDDNYDLYLCEENLKCLLVYPFPTFIFKINP